MNQFYNYLSSHSLWQLDIFESIKRFREDVRNKCHQDIRNKYNFRKYYDDIDYYYRCVSMNLFFVDAIIEYMKKQIAKKNIVNNPEENTSRLLFSEVKDK